MGAPKGNKNAKGNVSRAGRKSAYAEFLDAQWHKQMWDGVPREGDNLEGVDAKGLADKIAGGYYSVKDMFLYKALTGNERILAVFADKLLPSLNMHMGPTGEALDLTGEAKKRSAKYRG